ncbi:MAG: M20/M25/M40 family metallo-hydrolase [Chloroflexi bacterium]|nr:M20/M25/M40 family metallo-hydrolase [Chloroflexota bacterium]
MTVSMDQLERYIDAQFDQHVRDTQRLLRQPSISFTNEGVRECAAMLVDLLKEIGCERAELCELEGGYPAVFGLLRSKRPNAATLIAYSLYDVMPVDEPDWVVPPFSAEIVEPRRINLPDSYGPCIVARGARNQKGPIMALVNAIKTLQAVEGDIPCNVMFTFDGEEEQGSPHFPEFLRRYADVLGEASAVYYLNPAWDSEQRQQLYLGFRGVVPVELVVRGGDWGGPAGPQLFSADDALLDAPAWELAWALSTLRDRETGRVLVEGFYDDFRPPNAEERRLLDELKSSFDEAAVRDKLQARRWRRGQPFETVLERYLWEPYINLSGVVSGWTGPGIKTALPEVATAKMDIRLFPDMDRDDILRKLRAHLDKHGFQHVEIRCDGGYNWCRSSVEEPLAQACIRAAAAYGSSTLAWPIYHASTPLVAFTREPLSLPVVSGGIGYMGREHQANEYFTVAGLRLYEKYLCRLLHEFAGA